MRWIVHQMIVVLIMGIFPTVLWAKFDSNISHFETPFNAPPEANFWTQDLNREVEEAGEILAVGMASWYGPGFHGRRTASGERYNMHSFTCASRDLPFGTMLLIKNIENDQEVVVRVNDRGPFHPHRVLDLSFAAAKKLGFVGKGSARVEVRLASHNSEIGSI